MPRIGVSLSSLKGWICTSLVLQSLNTLFILPSIVGFNVWQEKPDICYVSAEIDQYSNMTAAIWPPYWRCPSNCICYTSNPTLEEITIVNCSATVANFYYSGIPEMLYENTTYLDMTGNYINEMSPTSFNNVTDLMYLDLGGNLFPHLGPRWFAKLHKLKALCLPGCGINTLDVYAFVGLEHLEVVDLTLNEIKSLPDFVFSPLINLLYLDLSKNFIYFAISPKAFTDTENLVSLNVSCNRLTRFPLNNFGFVVPYLKNLKCLSISENPVKIIGKDIGLFFDNVEILEIKRDAVFAKFWSLHGIFEEYKKLKTLQMQRAFIFLEHQAYYSIPASLLYNAYHIALRHCVPKGPLKTYTPEAYAQHNDFHLSYTYCSYCGWLLTVDEDSGSCLDMAVKFPNSTDVSNYAANSSHEKAVPVFRISNFSIFQNLIHLEELDLSSTKGVVLNSETFQNSAKIRRLILNNLDIDNQLYETGVMRPLTNLKTLHLSGNRIETVNFSLLPRNLWLQLTEIDLSNNPFNCECDLLWFRHWIQTTNVTVLNINRPSSYTCASPRHLKDFTILRVSIDHCNAAPPDSVLLILWLILVTLVLISVIGSLIHKFRWHVRYWQHQIQGNIRRHHERIDPHEYTYDAFVMYSIEDSQWVVKHLVPEIENNAEESLHLCIHQRDWLGGVSILENITESIESSRKCLVIVSNAFAKSNWCNYEMTMVQSRSITEDCANTVLVFLEEIAPINMTPRLRLQMQRQTYIEWTEDGVGQRLFWRRLRQALKKPHQSIVHSSPSRSEFIELVYCGWLLTVDEDSGSCLDMAVKFPNSTDVSNYAANSSHEKAVPVFRISNFSIFQNLIHLEELDLSSTKGVMLNSETFQNSAKIRKLILNNLDIDNQLYETGVMRPLTNLKTLHLSGNRIETVHFSLLPRSLWLQLTEIDLSNNPFNCECDLLWFRRWIQTTNVTVLNINCPSSYTCASPRHLKDFTILHV